MNYSLKKIVIFILVFTLIFNLSGSLKPIFFSPSPQKAEAILSLLPVDIANFVVTVGEWLAENWQEILRDVIAKRLLDYMTDQTITWIQGGGSPQFVTDFQGFLRDSASAAVGDVVLQTDAAFLCSPFKAQIMLQLQPTPKFSESVKCTLDNIVDNIDNFYSDFSKGGWIGYAEVMQPQNNYYGTALMVSAELNERTAKAVDAASKEVQAGSGFLSVKRCKGGGVTNPSPSDIDNLYLVKDFQGNYCQEKNLENTTPGNVVSTAVASAITSDSQWAANIQSVAAALVNALIDRLVKEGISTMKDSNSSNVNSAAGYTAAYNNAIAQNLRSGQSKMTESIKRFLDGWKGMLTKYNKALSFNTEIVGVLKKIKEKSCTIEKEPGVENILDAYKVGSVDQALEKANTDQTKLEEKVKDFKEMILEASSTIDQINILYLGVTSTSTMPTSATSTTSNSTSTLGDPLTMAKAQELFFGFINKYNNQKYLTPVLDEELGITSEADKEVADKENKARLAQEALSACAIP